MALASHGAGAVGCFADVLQVGANLVLRRDCRFRKVRVPDDRGQDVVEIVGDPPARRPRASIFCAWRSSLSRRARSLVSRMIPRNRCSPCSVNSPNEISTGNSPPHGVAPSH